MLANRRLTLSGNGALRLTGAGDPLGGSVVNFVSPDAWLLREEGGIGGSNRHRPFGVDFLQKRTVGESLAQSPPSSPRKNRKENPPAQSTRVF